MKKTLILLTCCSAMVFLFFAIFFHPSKIEALISVHQCNNCHSMHSPRGATLLKQIDAENTCLTCHSPAGPSSLKAAVHENSTFGGYRHTCLDCHDPHDNQQNILGSYNLKLIIGLLDTPNSGNNWDVIFISRGTNVGDPSQYSFADCDSAVNGICEVCHTQTRFIRNDGSGGRHQFGKTCVNCHPHINGFRWSN